MLIAQHLLACFMGGRWDSTAVGEARIPLKIKSLLSSQPTTTFPLATKKQSAAGAYFDGGDFGCLQTEITYNKKKRKVKTLRLIFGVEDGIGYCAA